MCAGKKLHSSADGQGSKETGGAIGAGGNDGQTGAGARVEIVYRQELDLDLDLPEDLEYLKQLEASKAMNIL